MTNEDAIKWLKDLLKNGDISMPQYEQALEMAIQALSSWEEYSDKLWKEAYERGKTEALSQECVGSTQKHVGNALDMRCDDLVSREAVMSAIGVYVVLEEYEDKSHTFTIRPLTKRIKQLPSVNPQPSEHFIDGVHAMGYREGYKDAQKQKSGKWIAVYQGDEIINYRCSECELGDTNGSTNLYGWDYCRRCGAKMESEVNNG